MNQKRALATASLESEEEAMADSPKPAIAADRRTILAPNLAVCVTGDDIPAMLLTILTNYLTIRRKTLKAQGFVHIAKILAGSFSR